MKQSRARRNKTDNQDKESACEQHKALAPNGRLQAFAQFADVAPKGQLSTAGEPGAAAQSTELGGKDKRIMTQNHVDALVIA